MSDDQSFYEIQLNTPHLVLAFLGAAAVGVAFFWLGVVVGRGQSQAGISPDWQAATPGDQAPPAEEKEPLEFYDTVGEPAGGGAATQPDSGAQQQAASPQTTGGSGFQPAQPVESGEPPQAAAPTPPSAASGQAAGQSATPDRSGMPREDPSLVSGWIVQVRSTTEKPQADSLQASLANAGFPAFVESAEVDGVTYYRVRVGRYRTQADARAIEALLITRGEATWVTEG